MIVNNKPIIVSTALTATPTHIRQFIKGLRYPFPPSKTKSPSIALQRRGKSSLNQKISTG
jgi:hypothetical protein